MGKSRLLVAGLSVLMAASGTARETRAQAAQTYSFTFSGPGVAGSLVLTYGAATDQRYAGAYKVTGISGTFTDTNNGLNIVNAPVAALVPVNNATPDSTNLLPPHDFSRFPVATGNPNGAISFDNLVWPGGSPQTATDYPFHGGFLDIYGLLFEIGGGRVANIWSNGDFGSGAIDYGAAVTTASGSLDYVEGGVTVSATPEPGSLWLTGTGGVGLIGVLARRRRSTAA